MGKHYNCIRNTDDRRGTGGEGERNKKFLLRSYRQADCPALAELFYKTVHRVNARDYTPEQLCACATGKVDLDVWNRLFLQHHTLAAEADGVILGFGNMDDTGYLDRLYVHKAYQRRGVASAICDALEKDAAATVYTTHASITAKPFFRGVPGGEVLPAGGL